MKAITKTLIDSVRRHNDSTWFEPLFASQNPADSILVRRFNSEGFRRISDFVLLEDNRTCLALDSWSNSDEPRHLTYFDVTDGRTIHRSELPIGGGVYSLELSPNQSRVLIYGQEILVWDVAERKLLDVVAPISGYMTRLMYSPDGQFLVRLFSKGELLIDHFVAKQLIHIKADEEDIRAFQISPDSKWLLTGGADRIVKLWDLATGEKLAEHDEHTDAIADVDISVDGLWARTSSGPRDIRTDKEYETVLYWNLQTFALSAKGPQVSIFRKGVVTSDGRFRFRTTVAGIQILDAEKGKLRDSFQAHSRAIGKLKLTDDNRYLVTSADDQGIVVWDAQTIIESPEQIELFNRRLPHKDVVAQTAITSDGKFGVTASWDGTVLIWNMATQTIRHRLKQLGGKSNYAIVISPDDRVVIAAGEDGAMNGWDLETGQVVAVFGYRPFPQAYRHTLDIKTLAIHPSPLTPLLVSGAGNGLAGFVGTDRGEAKLWNYWNASHIADLVPGDEQISRIRFASDGRRLVVGTGYPMGDSDKTASLFVTDLVRENTVRINLALNAVGDLLFSGDGRFLAASAGALIRKKDSEEIAFVYACSDWEIAYRCVLEEATGYIESLQFAHDRPILFGAAKGSLANLDGQIYGWDLSLASEEGIVKPSHIYAGHIGDANQIAVTKDDRYLVSRGADQTLRLWDLKLQVELAMFQTDVSIEHFSLANDDRTILAGCADGRVHIFRIHV